MKTLFKVCEKQLAPVGHHRLFGWSPRGNLLAVAVAKTKVQSNIVLYDRQGEVYKQISVYALLSSAKDHEGAAVVSQLDDRVEVTHLEWDAAGERLAIFCAASPVVILWPVSGVEASTVHIGMKHDISYAAWHPRKPILAVGTSKGALVLYDDDKKKRTPIVGKHSRGIACGCWSDTGLLALGSYDQQFSISRADGEPLSQMSMRGDVKEVKFSPGPRHKGEAINAGSASGSVLRASINVSGKSLFLVETSEESMKDQTVPKYSEIVLEERYGQLMVHQWNGMGYIILGTSSGHVIIVSADKDSDRQFYPYRFFRNKISDLAISFHASVGVPRAAEASKDRASENGDVLAQSQGTLLACCGTVNVVLLDISVPSEVAEIVWHTLPAAQESSRDAERTAEGKAGHGGRRGSLYRWGGSQGPDGLGDGQNKAEHLHWTKDGQILSVSSSDGTVHSLLVSLPKLGAASHTRILYLTSLVEMSIIDTDAVHKIELSTTGGGKEGADFHQEGRGSDSPRSGKTSGLHGSNDRVHPSACQFEVEMEPSFCALGPHHAAVGINNQFWVYSIDAIKAITERKGGASACKVDYVGHYDYIGTIQAVRVNGTHAVALAEGKVHLHRISGDEEVIVPEKHAVADISCIEVTETFLIAGTSSGSIFYWLLADPTSGRTYDDEEEGEEEGEWSTGSRSK